MNTSIDTHINNLKTISTERQGTLFYNEKKGMFEKQNYTNWFVNALKVLFVSPIRYMFGFTSNKETVFGGLQNLVAATEKCLQENSSDPKKNQLLALIKKVKDTTLPTLIQEKKAAKLYAQEAALIKLQEQILFVKAPKTNPEPIPNPTPDTPQPTTPTQPNVPQDQQPTDTQQNPTDTTMTQQNTGPDAPMMKSPAKRGPGSVRTLGSPRGGPVKAVVSKEEKIANLSKAVEELKGKYETLLSQHGNFTVAKRENQAERKKNETRSNILNKGFETVHKDFKIAKGRVTNFEKELVALQEKQALLHAVVKEREAELEKADLTKGIVNTLVEDIKAEVPIDAFKKGLEDAQEIVKEADLAVENKQNELEEGRKAYQRVLEMEMTINGEKNTIGAFLTEQEQVKAELVRIGRKQDEMEKEQLALVPQVNEAKRAMVIKQKELDRESGKKTQVEEGNDLSTPKKAENLDPNAILAFHEKKKEQIALNISRSFSSNHILSPRKK